jgi:hypothetical protein
MEACCAQQGVAIKCKLHKKNKEIVKTFLACLSMGVRVDVYRSALSVFHHKTPGNGQKE